MTANTSPRDREVGAANISRVAPWVASTSACDAARPEDRFYGKVLAAKVLLGLAKLLLINRARRPRLEGFTILGVVFEFGTRQHQVQGGHGFPHRPTHRLDRHFSKRQRRAGELLDGAVRTLVKRRGEQQPKSDVIIGQQRSDSSTESRHGMTGRAEMAGVETSLLGGQSATVES